MPRVDSKSSTKPSAVRPGGTIKPGDIVVVTTVYRVKRVEVPAIGSSEKLVAVEDDRGDRVLTFRLGELKRPS